MITKENLLMITQDAKTRDERYLSIMGDIDLENVPAFEGGQTIFWGFLLLYLWATYLLIQI